MELWYLCPDLFRHVFFNWAQPIFTAAASTNRSKAFPVVTRATILPLGLRLGFLPFPRHGEEGRRAGTVQHPPR